MTLETLEKAKELQKKIAKIKSRLSNLEETFRQFKVDGYKPFLIKATNCNYNVSIENVSNTTCNAIYMLVKSDLETQLSELEKQLEEL